MGAMATRVVIVGLDGVSFSLIDPWIVAGELPKLACIKAQAACAVMESTIPPVSLPAWPTFQTGKNPGKHGLFGFYRDGPVKTFFDARHLGAETLWDMLASDGRRAVAINVPGTYPPPPLDGALISCMLTPSERDAYTYPASLKAELLSAIGEYVIDFDRTKRGMDSLEDLCRVSEKRFEATQYLWKRVEWDLFCVVFTETDRAQHRFYHAPEELLRLFRKIDGYLGEILSWLREDDLLIILSDHGFGEVRKHIFLNSWLREEGYLATRLTRQDKVRRRTGRRKPSLLERLFRRYGAEIDWERTRAYLYSAAARAVNVNLKGREPSGTVEPTEFEAHRAALVEKLCELRDPDTREPLFSRVLRREDIYRGEYADSVPDILTVFAAAGYAFKRRPDARRIVQRCSRPRAGHTPHGIFMLRGRGIRPLPELPTVHLTDVVPTALWALGVPIPEDLDGRVLTELFEEGAIAAKPPRFRPPRKKLRMAGAVEPTEELEDRLRQLGYID